MSVCVCVCVYRDGVPGIAEFVLTLTVGKSEYQGGVARCGRGVDVVTVLIENVCVSVSEKRQMM